MLTVLGVAMGIDIDAMERPEGSSEMPPGMGGSSASATQSFPSEPSSSVPEPSSAPKAKPKEPEPEPEPMEVDSSDAGAKKEAEELKVKGNTAYKARKFDEAIELYTKAWDTHKDITYLSNLSGESVPWFDRHWLMHCSGLLRARKLRPMSRNLPEGHR